MVAPSKPRSPKRTRQIRRFEFFCAVNFLGWALVPKMDSLFLSLLIDVPDRLSLVLPTTILEFHRSIREVWIFTSPKAGTGAGREQILRLMELCRADGLVCRRVDQVAELDQTLTLGMRDDLAVVAAGGDGTLALLAGRVPAGTALLPMPMGTENLLARHYRYPREADRVMDSIRAGRTMAIDAGRANGKLFLVMVTAGFDAEVVRAMHLTRRGHINRFSYLGPIWRAMRRYAFPIVQASIRGQDGSISQTSGCWMMAFNLPCYAASLPIEPHAIADDGSLDLVNLNRGSVPAGLRYLLSLPGGRHLKRSDVSRHSATRVTLTSSVRVPYQIDGDYAGRLPVEIEVLPRHVTLLCPTPIES